MCKTVLIQIELIFRVALFQAIWFGQQQSWRLTRNQIVWLNWPINKVWPISAKLFLSDQSDASLENSLPSKAKNRRRRLKRSWLRTTTASDRQKITKWTKQWRLPSSSGRKWAMPPVHRRDRGTGTGPWPSRTSWSSSGAATRASSTNCTSTTPVTFFYLEPEIILKLGSAVHGADRTAAVNVIGAMHSCTLGWKWTKEKSKFEQINDIFV